MTISILVVDDVMPIAEGFAGKFRRVAEDDFNVKATVEVICSSDEAIRWLADPARTPIDLLFTDIDLTGADDNDKSGVAIARYARTALPTIPRVGCSGKFLEDELSDDDRGVFDYWWPKLDLQRNLDAIAKDVIMRAMAHRDQHRSLQPTKTTTQELGLTTPVSEKEFLEEGFVQKVIEPSIVNGLAEPFAVWVRSGSGGVELEVVGRSALFSCGDTFDLALEALLENIRDIKQHLADPDESFGASMLNAKVFVQVVTGSR